MLHFGVLSREYDMICNLIESSCGVLNSELVDLVVLSSCFLVPPTFNEGTKGYINSETFILKQSFWGQR